MKEKLTTAIGLDVGNCHINMLKLSREPQGLRLVDFVSIDLNPLRGREGKLRRLEKIAQEKAISAHPVNIGVSGDSVIVRYIDLPKMNQAEVAQALKYEAQQYIPFKMEEVIFDYHILKSLDAGQERMKVLLVAAKRQAITELVQLIQQAGLKPNLIDVNSFSLINSFQLNGPEVREGAAFALVNLEFDLVNIDILQGQTPFFTRDISLLKEILSLPQQKDRTEIEFLEAMKPLLANLIREIRLSIDYYESEFEKQVALIYLSGEVARNPELINFFSSQLERDVELWNPVQNLLVDSMQVNTDALGKVSCMLALACGLALRETK